MFEAGLIEEVRAILSSGYPASAKPFESHGYRQAIDLIEGRLTCQEALSQACQNTRNYAKRQWTWFRQDKEVLWFAGFGDEPAVRLTVLEKVREFVSGFAAD